MRSENNGWGWILKSWSFIGSIKGENKELGLNLLAFQIEWTPFSAAFYSLCKNKIFLNSLILYFLPFYYSKYIFITLF